MENQINFFTVQDLYDHVDKAKPIDFNKIYDPLKFWDDFGDKYYRSFKKQQDLGKYVSWILPRLKLMNVDKLLDAGCGFCRLEPFILNGEGAKEITAIDISQKQLDCVDDYLKDYDKRDKIKTIKQTIKWSSMEPHQFDCVLSVECLQHMHLPSVRYAVHNMKKLTKKYIILIERFVVDGEHPSPHMWSHNYHKLFTDIGVKVLESSIIGPGLMGMVLCK